MLLKKSFCEYTMFYKFNTGNKIEIFIVLRFLGNIKNTVK